MEIKKHVVKFDRQQVLGPMKPKNLDYVVINGDVYVKVDDACDLPTSLIYGALMELGQQADYSPENKASNSKSFRSIDDE